MTFIAGPYTATWTPPSSTAKALGILQDGFDLEWVMHGEVIKGDNLGDSIQDGVYRGGDCFISCICEEFDAAALYGTSGTTAQVFNPASNTFGKHGQAGVLFSALAGILALSRVSAATGATPNITADKAILANEHVIRSKLASRLRVVPLRLLLLPYTNSGSTVWFVPSVPA